MVLRKNVWYTTIIVKVNNFIDLDYDSQKPEEGFIGRR